MSGGVDSVEIDEPALDVDRSQLHADRVDDIDALEPARHSSLDRDGQ